MVIDNQLVSIIIPTYNRSASIVRSIKSVLAQSYKNIEVIIVDDASTDNSIDLIKKISDPRLRLVCHAENKGGAAARNTGIKASKGEFIAFQDSDDIWLPEKLAKQMHAFADHADISAVYCSYELNHGREKLMVPSGAIRQKAGDILQGLLSESFIGTPTLVVRSSVFNKIGFFDENLHRFQDWDMVIRIAREYHFAFIDEPLVKAYSTSDSISQNINSIEAWEKIFIKHFDLINKDSRLLAKHYGALGHLNTLHKSSLKGRKFFLKSIYACPSYMKAWAGLLMALPGRSFYIFLLGIMGRL